MTEAVTICHYCQTPSKETEYVMGEPMCPGCRL